MLRFTFESFSAKMGSRTIMTLLQLENLIKKELSLSNKQFHKLFGKPFEHLKHEQMLKKISIETSYMNFTISNISKMYGITNEKIKAAKLRQIIRKNKINQFKHNYICINMGTYQTDFYVSWTPHKEIYATKEDPGEPGYIEIERVIDLKTLLPINISTMTENLLTKIEKSLETQLHDKKGSE